MMNIKNKEKKTIKKKEKAITLISLVITIMVIGIITITITYNIHTSTNVQKLTQLRADISILESKVSDFYNEYGNIPATIEYTNINNIKPILNNVENDINSKFYVIDLQAMKGISLNYGQDYEKVKDTNTQTANKYSNLYIINEKTHNIFYVKGVSIKDKNETKIYYAKYDTAQNVPTIDMSLKPGQVVTGETRDYIDGDKVAKVPVGFKVSEVATEQNIDTGLVVIAPDGSEYVWIPVDGTNIKLNRYLFDDYDGTPIEQNNNIINEYYQELSTSTYGNTTAKNLEQFKTSVTENKGYYIARYEASKGSTGKAESKISTQEPALLDEPVNTGMLWNNITQPEASIACQNLYSSINSDLMNSYAWDTAIVFVQKNDNREEGNREFPYSKQVTLNDTLLNTGTTGDVICNIYDMASNCWEWTTETWIDIGAPCVIRGGNYNYIGGVTCERLSYDNTDKFETIAFRPILYL